jgi:3-hydroxyisobutyrate dehydrogenase-like beta-hydroxyacid dehydrogenase
MIRVAAAGDVRLAPDVRGRIRPHLADITERSFEPQFKLRLAAKDASLMEDAMHGHQLELPLVTAIARQLARGAEDNPGKDMSTSYLTSAPGNRGGR